MKDTQLKSLEKELQVFDEDLTIFGDSELAESFDADILGQCDAWLPPFLLSN